MRTALLTSTTATAAFPATSATPPRRACTFIGLPASRRARTRGARMDLMGAAMEDRAVPAVGRRVRTPATFMVVDMSR